MVKRSDFLAAIAAALLTTAIPAPPPSSSARARYRFDGDLRYPASLLMPHVRRAEAGDRHALDLLRNSYPAIFARLREVRAR